MSQFRRHKYVLHVGDEGWEVLVYEDWTMDKPARMPKKANDQLKMWIRILKLQEKCTQKGINVQELNGLIDTLNMTIQQVYVTYYDAWSKVVDAKVKPEEIPAYFQELYRQYMLAWRG